MVRKRKHRDGDDLGNDDEEYAAGGGFHDPELQPSATAALQAARAKAARDRPVKKPKGGGKRPEVEPGQQIVLASATGAAPLQKPAALPVSSAFPPPTQPVRASAGRKGGDSRRA